MGIALKWQYLLNIVAATGLSRTPAPRQNDSSTVRIFFRHANP
jgi:hypothetical protein